MAFPGGRAEPEDGAPRETAERETLEEVGLDLVSSGTYLGSLDDLRTPPRRGRFNMVISPHVYAVDHDPELIVDAREVAGVVWIPLISLVRGVGRGTLTRSWKGIPWSFPAIHLGEGEIWGLTLRMVDDLVERVPGEE